MAKEEINLRITAKDDASKVIDPLVKKVDKLDGTAAEIEVKADSKKAERSVADLIKDVDKLDGETASIVLAMKGADVQKKLGDVLEQIALADGEQVDIDVRMTEAASLKSDLDSIEAKVKAINGVPLDIDTRGVSTSFQRAKGEAEGFKAGVVNSAADLTGVLGGELSQSINNFGQGFVGAAEVAGPALATMGISVEALMGPLALVGIAVGGLKALWDANKKKAEENKKATKEWADAIKEANGHIEDAAKKKLVDTFTPEQLAIARKYNLRLQDFVDLVQGKTVPAYDELRKKAQEYADAIIEAGKHGQPVSPEINDQLRQTAIDFDKLGGSVNKNAGEFSKAVTDIDNFNAFVGDSADASEEAKKATDRFTASQEDLSTAIDTATTALEDQQKFLQDQLDAAKAGADLGIALEKAEHNLTAAIQARKDALEAGKKAETPEDRQKAADDYVKAVEDERDAVIDAGKAQQDYREQQATAQGTVLSATQKVDGLNQSLEEQAKRSGPEAEKSVYNYLIQLNEIPEEKQTAIYAAVDAGKLDEANALIDEASKTRNVALNVDADTTEAMKKIVALGAFIRQQFAGVTDLPVLDQGGTARGFGGIAGERGPEILNERYVTAGPTYVPPGTRVTSRRRTAVILRSPGARGLKRYDAGGTVPRAFQPTINVNAAVIGNTFDVMHAVSDAMRRAERLLPRHP